MDIHQDDRAFAHRQRVDGTFDSICMGCFQAVASQVSVSDLERPEREHVRDSQNRNRQEQQTEHNPSSAAFYSHHRHLPIQQAKPCCAIGQDAAFSAWTIRFSTS
jgi:hypothetical protein